MIFRRGGKKQEGRSGIRRDSSSPTPSHDRHRGKVDK